MPVDRRAVVDNALIVRQSLEYFTLAPYLNRIYRITTF